MKQKLLFLLVLLLTATTGTWAQTTYTVAGSNAAMFGSAWDPSYTANDMTKNGDGTYSITYTNVYLTGNVEYKVVKDHSWSEAYPGENRVINIAEAGTYTVTIHFNPTTHEVYETMPSTYTVSLKDGVKDAANWTIASGDKSVKGNVTDGLTGLSEGAEVTVTYTGRMKVKSVTATTDAAPAKTPATVTTAPTGAAVVGVGKTTALVSGGAADGGTLRYAVTTTNTKPTSTAGFSEAVPTAQTITASGKVYVWYFVKADDTHTDSEIAATAIEVPVADIVWDVMNVSDLRVMGSFASYTMEGITLSGKTDMMEARWYDFGNPEMDGIGFEMFESGGYTFTAPTGKNFTKIEMTLTGSAGWEYTNLGSDWAFNADWEKNIFTVTWTGSAASTVGLLTGADEFMGERVKSIAFYLSE